MPVTYTGTYFKTYAKICTKNFLQTKTQKLFFLSLLVMFVCLPSPAQSAENSGLQIKMVSTPSIEQIRPDLDITQFSVLVTDAQGQPVKNLDMAFTLQSPAKKFFPSTDFPVVEGTTLMKSKVLAPEGKLDFQYVFPIRGEYTLKVTAAPQGKPNQVVEKSIRFSLRENPPEVRNGLILMSGMGLLGGLVGFLLTARRIAGEVA